MDTPILDGIKKEAGWIGVDREVEELGGYHNVSPDKHQELIEASLQRRLDRRNELVHAMEDRITSGGRVTPREIKDGLHIDTAVGGISGLLLGGALGGFYGSGSSRLGGGFRGALKGSGIGALSGAALGSGAGYLYRKIKGPTSLAGKLEKLRDFQSNIKGQYDYSRTPEGKADYEEDYSMRLENADEYPKTASLATPMLDGIRKSAAMTPQMSGALIGGGLGAIGGALADRNNRFRGAMFGAGVGGAAGYASGRYSTTPGGYVPNPDAGWFRQGVDATGHSLASIREQLGTLYNNYKGIYNRVNPVTQA